MFHLVLVGFSFNLSFTPFSKFLAQSSSIRQCGCGSQKKNPLLIVVMLWIVLAGI